mgnify:CR=1 FL=1
MLARGADPRDHRAGRRASRIPPSPSPRAPEPAGGVGQGIHDPARRNAQGNIVRFAPSVAIEGTLDGDLYTTASTVRISGVVTGDVFAAGSQVDLTGKVKKSFRAAAGNVVGRRHRRRQRPRDRRQPHRSAARRTSREASSAYTGQFTHHGVVDGSLDLHRRHREPRRQGARRRHAHRRRHRDRARARASRATSRYSTRKRMDDGAQGDRRRGRRPTTRAHVLDEEGRRRRGAEAPADDVRRRQVDRVLHGIVPVRLRAPRGVQGARAQGDARRSAPTRCGAPESASCRSW